MCTREFAPAGEPAKTPTETLALLPGYLRRVARVPRQQQTAAPEAPSTQGMQQHHPLNQPNVEAHRLLKVACHSADA